ncbi:uncharacterized protein LOC123557770 [Mercenaria mercenaria]|uniref:uncharacterized protein LOC123557770 n=1 Tax=Mercenaria mercenaria TaxID=6596 RepID=UPI00234E6919|nr:uncharacterized protein LOC123557770 [Mercenaria mercenaria]
MMIDAEDIRLFIDGLTLDVNVFNFEQLVTFPAAFSDLGKVNKVSDAKSVELERPCGKLKDFIKRISDDFSKDEQLHKSEGAKRKSVSSGDGHIAKQRKGNQERKFVKDNEPEQELDLHGDEAKETIKQLNNFFAKDNLLQLEKVLEKSRDKAELEIGLGIHIISKLAGIACTCENKSKLSCPCGCGQYLQGNDKMWIGSDTTWYGELDIISGSPTSGDTVAITVANELESSEVEDDDDDEEEYIGEEMEDVSDGISGDFPNVESKFSGTNQRINQTVAQAVVFAFTEYNRHREKEDCIPSIIIDKNCFRFVIYNPVDDKLVVSNLINYKKKEFNPKNIFRSILVLWIILNHRLFFAKSPSSLQFYLKSGFHEKMSHIHNYKKLNDYSKHIVCRSKNKFDSYDDSINAVDLETYEWFMQKL